MTSQVFISYSSKDKAIADTICQWLESAGIPCWMAPRNIEFGSDWTGHQRLPSVCARLFRERERFRPCATGSG
jgi:hypothetical protein